ncbi:hypothetical protein DFS34DRAFT_683199 [Phlyctochytrium arcticum]|nr:hypothetical protein DFS34DRAFT_683199 [Phlyctochytrium arcticum]
MRLISIPTLKITARQLIPLPPAVAPPTRPVDCSTTCIESAIREIRNQQTEDDDQRTDNRSVCEDGMGQAFFERCLSWGGERCRQELGALGSTSNRGQYSALCPDAIKNLPQPSPPSDVPSNSLPSPTSIVQRSSPSAVITTPPTIRTPPVIPASTSPLAQPSATSTILVPATSSVIVIPTGDPVIISTSPTNTANTTLQPNTSSNLAAVTIAGVASGIVLILLLLLCICLWRRSRLRDKATPEVLADGGENLLKNGQGQPQTPLTEKKLPILPSMTSTQSPSQPNIDPETKSQDSGSELALIGGYAPPDTDSRTDSIQSIFSTLPIHTLTRQSGARHSWWAGASSPDIWRKSTFFASYGGSVSPASSFNSDKRKSTPAMISAAPDGPRRAHAHAGIPVVKPWDTRHWADISLVVGARVEVWAVLEDKWIFGMTGSFTASMARGGSGISPMVQQCGFFPRSCVLAALQDTPKLTITRVDALAQPDVITALGGGPTTYLASKREFCLRALASGLLSASERKLWATELEFVQIRMEGQVGAGAGPFRSKAGGLEQRLGRPDGALKRLMKGIRHSGQSTDSSVSIPKDQW